MEEKQRMCRAGIDDLAWHLICCGHDHPVRFTLEVKDAEAWPPWYELCIGSFCGSRHGILAMNSSQAGGDPHASVLKDEKPAAVTGIISKWIGDESRKYKGVTGNVIISYTAEELWDEFGDVPMDPETETIERDWNGFPAGTRREEIWSWFEDYFSIPVYSLMFPETKEMPCPDMETPFPPSAITDARYNLGVRHCIDNGYNPGKWILPISCGDARRLWDTEAPVEIAVLHGDGTETLVEGEDDLEDEHAMFGADIGSIIAAFYDWLDT